MRTHTCIFNYGIVMMKNIPSTVYRLIIKYAKNNGSTHLHSDDDPREIKNINGKLDSSA